MVARHADQPLAVMSTYYHAFEKVRNSTKFRAIARIPSFAGPIFVLI
jgi:hypothetical protein